MQLEKIVNAKIVTPQGIVEGGLLYETGGRILAVGELPDVRRRPSTPEAPGPCPAVWTRTCT